MEPVCLIWSNEHRAWWRDAANGYTTDIREAGTYPRSEASDICDNATLDWTQAPSEVMVRLDDLPQSVRELLFTETL